MNTHPMQHTSPVVVANGGATINITLVNGATVELKVPVLSMRKAQEYLQKKGDPTELIKLCIPGATDEWIDSLTPESFFAIDEKVREVNDPLIDAWMTRQLQVVEGMKAKVKGIEDRVRGSTSSSPTQ